MVASSSRAREIRCAVYTRKSTEEGLDQAFNSLDAQREACAAYILSQVHEGWTLLPTYYDDGGYSGGNMSRPGLIQLLADVRASKVDVIVVYKVDRLTRSLSDFARIVDVLDAAGASFVSITQAFNTTTSMGRLTLNVLLSFAQFEREVISERVRDKVAASKKRGMWMGGPEPLGYAVADRKLVINQAEAVVVRHIFNRYLELGSVRLLAQKLTEEGIRTKTRVDSNGAARGGKTFSRGQLYLLLQNRLYIGEVVHQNHSYPGEHEAIVPPELWQAVQEKLSQNRVERRTGRNHKHLCLLAGMVSDSDHGPLAVEHANKGSARYRYYVSRPDEGRKAVRLPALKLERLILGSLAAALSDTAALAGQLAPQLDGAELDYILRHWKTEGDRIAIMAQADLRAMLRQLDLTVRLDGEEVLASIALERLVDPEAGTEARLSLIIPAKLARRGHEQRLMYLPKQGAPSRRDPILVQLLATAHTTRRGIIEGTITSRGEQPSQERRHLMRLARLSYLAPDIVQAIVDGAQPEQLTARRMLREANIPLAWAEQRRLFGFA